MREKAASFASPLAAALAAATTAAGCFATVTPVVAGIDVAWSFADELTCDSAGVTGIVITTRSDDESQTIRRFPCETRSARLMVPPGFSELVIEGVAEGASAPLYTASLGVLADEMKTVDIGELTLQPVEPGDLLLRIFIRRLCIAGIEPASVVVTVDNRLGAPPILAPFCTANVDGIDVVVFELDPGPHELAVLGFDQLGETLFHESTTSVVRPGLVLVVFVDVQPPADPDDTDDPRDDDEPRDDLDEPLEDPGDAPFERRFDRPLEERRMPVAPAVPAPE